MKGIVVLFLCLFAAGYGESPYQYQVESVAYETIEDRTNAHVFLTNSYELIFSVDPSTVYQLLDFAKVCVPGKTVQLSTVQDTSFIELCIGRKKYQVSLSKETIDLFPKITGIEADAGWIFTDYFVYLDDGTCWKVLVCPHTPCWNIGNRVLTQELDHNKFALINVDAPHKNHFGFDRNNQKLYTDRRMGIFTLLKQEQEILQ